MPPRNKTATKTASPATPAKTEGKAKKGSDYLFPIITVNNVEVPPVVIGVEEAKELLGWTVLPEGDQTTPLLTDYENNRIVCTNNDHNREFIQDHAYALSQDILQKKWADSRWEEDMTNNGENIIISRTGKVASGQHRLVALVLAHQCYASTKFGTHWQDTLWQDGPPTIETMILRGTSDNHKVTRTLDCGRARTLADAIFASSNLYGSVKREDRAALAKLTDHAIRFLWSRTGYAERQNFNPFAVQRTHAETMAFLDRHPTLAKCVEHIHRLNAPRMEKYQNDKGETKERLGKPPIGAYVPAGYAAAMMYLMATSGSDINLYKNLQPFPAEKDDKGNEVIDFSYMERAQQFWEDFAGTSSNADHLAGLFECFDEWYEPYTNEKGEGDTREREDLGSSIQVLRQTAICKAWNVYCDGEAVVSPDQCRPVMEAQTKGGQTVYVLKDYPSFGGREDSQGGIDVGPKKPKPPKEAAPAGDAASNGEVGDGNEDDEPEEGSLDDAIAEASAAKAEEEANKPSSGSPRRGKVIK